MKRKGYIKVVLLLALSTALMGCGMHNVNKEEYKASDFMNLEVIATGKDNDEPVVIYRDTISDVLFYMKGAWRTEVMVPIPADAEGNLLTFEMWKERQKK